MSSGRNSCRRARRQGGFAILEALIAMVIFAAVLVLVHQTLASGWSAARRVALENKAVGLARALMASVGPEQTLREGAIAGREHGMRWRVDISRYALTGRTIETPRLAAWWVTVEVAWHESPLAAERVVALTTLKLGGPLR